MMDNETRAELIEDAEAFRAIDEMVKTTGWQNVVIPRIEQLKESSMKTLITATNYRDIVRAQETVKAVEDILLTLMMKMKMGEEAIELLDKQE